MPDIVTQASLKERLENALGNRRDVWVAAGALVLVVIVALGMLGGGATARIAPPAGDPVAGAAPLPSPTAVVFVDVGGAVRSPGLYSLPVGTRVADALAAAGGARPRADLSALNLAQVLVDGTKVDVPTTRSTGAIPPPAPSAAAPSQATVSLNAADQAALETIPGVGPVTATAILAYRQQIGAFESIDQLLDVDGIGPATLEAIRPYVSL